jgi:hypothetical protein
MVLVLVAVVGLLIGFWLGMSRAGYVTTALTSVGFSVGQFVQISIAQTRNAISLWPLETGLVLVLCMLLGALVRLATARRKLGGLACEPSGSELSKRS